MQTDGFNEVTEIVDMGMHSVDVRKAFDKVSHNRLFGKVIARGSEVK